MRVWFNLVTQGDECDPEIVSDIHVCWQAHGTKAQRVICNELNPVQSAGDSAPALEPAKVK